MTVEKNLIEIVRIDGKSLPVERQKGNCWVNLTEMAKPFGKQPIHWLRSKDAQNYLQALVEDIKEQTANSQFGVEDLIIIRKGGKEGESGTWCTDYRVAMRLAQWLDQKFSVKVDTLLVRIVNGELIVSDGNTFMFRGKEWVSCTAYCRQFGRTMHSFYGLKASYPYSFMFVEGQWYMSRDLFNMKEVQARFESSRSEIRRQNADRQLSFEFAGMESEGKEG